MRRTTPWAVIGFACLVTLACGGGGGGQPGGGDDPAVPKEGFGALSGDCGAITAAVLDSSSSALFRCALDFGTDPYDDTDYDQLSPGGRKVLDDGLGGGSSVLSEVFAYEVLTRCEDSVLLKTGAEIVYVVPGGKTTDLLVRIAGRRVGVAVTRAVAFPPTDPYTLQQAQNQLEDVLGDIAGSTANVAPEDAWTKQVLCVLAYSPQHADALQTAWAALDASTQGDTILWIVVTNGDDGFLY